MTSVIVVAGRADSEELAIAYSVLWAAKQKYGKLFESRVFRILPNEYQDWLQRTLSENKWGELREEVVTWIELGFKGGPKDFIGGLDTFLEYMYENYKVLRPIKRERAECVAQKTIDQMHSDEFLEELESSRPNRTFVIAILGAGHKACFPLMYELLRARFCIDHHGTAIQLHDHDTAQLERIAQDLNSMEGLLNAGSTVKVFSDMVEAVQKVNLLIFLGDESTAKEVQLGRKLRKTYYLYKLITQKIDPHLNNTVRVVFTCMDYRCYIASVFMKYSKNVNPNYVMAITSHLALEPISYMAKATGLPQSHFLYQSSIVWGCVGLSHCVDLSNGDLLYNMMRFKNNFPPGDYETDDFLKEFNHEHWGEDNWILRKQDYLVQSIKNIWYYVGKQKECLFDYMNVKTYISQVKATMDTLNRWYDPNPKNDPLSAGIWSDGTYGFPIGLFMSQPVTIDKSTQELRVKAGVLKSKDLLNLSNLVLFPIGILKRLIHGRIYKEIIVDQDFITLVEIGDQVIKEREEKRLEKERIKELTEEAEEEEVSEEVMVEEEEPAEAEEEAQVQMKLSEEEMEEEQVEVEEIRSTNQDVDTIEEVEFDKPAEPDIRPFLDATYMSEPPLEYYIGLSDRTEPLYELDLTEEQREFLSIINEYRGKSVKEAYILRKKEIYPPNGVREFDKRPGRNKDPAYAAVRPVKFIDVPVLTIQWKEIKRVIERLQQLKKKSRRQILEFYADKIMHRFNAKERKKQKKMSEGLFNPDGILSDDDLDSDNEITPKIKKVPQMETSFLFKPDFKIDFTFHDSRPFQREFTESMEDYEKRAFISTLQSIEDFAEKVYHKHANSLNI